MSRSSAISRAGNRLEIVELTSEQAAATDEVPEEREPEDLAAKIDGAGTLDELKQVLVGWLT